MADFCLDLFQGSLRKHTATGLQVTEPEKGMLKFTLVFRHIPVFSHVKVYFLEIIKLKSYKLQRKKKKNMALLIVSNHHSNKTGDLQSAKTRLFP